MANLGVVGRRLASIGVDPELKVFLVLVRADGFHLAVGGPQWPLSAPESNFSKLYTSLSYCCVMPAWTGWKDSYAEMVVASAVFFWEIMSL